MDPLIFGLIKDPRDYGSFFMPKCPSGAMAIAAVSCILALMASPPLFEKFHHISLAIMT